MDDGLNGRFTRVTTACAALHKKDRLKSGLSSTTLAILQLLVKPDDRDMCHSSGKHDVRGAFRHIPCIAQGETSLGNRANDDFLDAILIFFSLVQHPFLNLFI